MGQFFNQAATINQTGGNVGFFTAITGGTSTDLGRFIVRNNNAANYGRYVYNLNGGVFTVGQIGVAVSSFGAATGNLNVRPTLNINGGTLRVASSSGTTPNPTSTFFNRNPLNDGNGN